MGVCPYSAERGNGASLGGCKAATSRGSGWVWRKKARKQNFIEKEKKRGQGWRWRVGVWMWLWMREPPLPQPQLGAGPTDFGPLLLPNGRMVEGDSLMCFGQDSTPLLTSFWIANSFSTWVNHLMATFHKIILKGDSTNHSITRDLHGDMGHNQIHHPKNSQTTCK